MVARDGGRTPRSLARAGSRPRRRGTMTAVSSGASDSRVRNTWRVARGGRPRRPSRPRRGGGDRPRPRDVPARVAEQRRQGPGRWAGVRGDAARHPRQGPGPAAACGCSRIACCSSRRPGWRRATVEALDHYLFSEKVSLDDVTARVRALHARRPRRPGPRASVVIGVATAGGAVVQHCRHARRHRGAAGHRWRRDGRRRGVGGRAGRRRRSGREPADRGRRPPDRRRSARGAAHRGRDAALRAATSARPCSCPRCRSSRCSPTPRAAIPARRSSCASAIAAT